MLMRMLWTTQVSDPVKLCGEEAKQMATIAFFAKFLFTAQRVQLVVMSLGPGEEIGLETHGGFASKVANHCWMRSVP